MRAVLLLIAVGIFVSVPASAFELGVVGVLGYTTYAPSPADPTSTYSANSGLGYGVLVDFPWVPRLLAVEGGLFYVPRSIHSVTSLGPADTTFNSLQIPVLVRFTGLPLVSFGAGGYFAGGLVNTSVSMNGWANPFDFSVVGLSQVDFGVLGSAALSLELLPGFNLYLDARYLLGLTNASTLPGVTAHFEELQLLSGIKLGI